MDVWSRRYYWYSWIALILAFMNYKDNQIFYTLFCTAYIFSGVDEILVKLNINNNNNK